MAVENYDPIVLNEGECLGQDWFEPTYESLSALEQAAKNGAGTFECVHFSGQISGVTNAGEVCVQAVAPADMPREYLNGDQICCLMLSFGGAMQSPVFVGDTNNGLPQFVIGSYFTSQDINISVRCSGQTVTSSGGQGNGVLTAQLDSGACDFSQGLEVCVDATASTQQRNGEMAYGISWCGCLICVQCPPLPLTDYYIPKRPPNPGCEYGLGDLSLVIHTLNQMNAAFRFGGYSVECVTREELSESVPIASNLETDVKWLGLACTRVDWIGAPARTYFRVDVTMGCSARPIKCNVNNYLTRSANTTGAEFVSIACGECRKGESIWFGASPQYQCSIVDEEVGGDPEVPVLEGKSDIVFWVFRRIENDLPNLPQISTGCVFSDTAEAITLGSEAINQAACNVEKLQKIPKDFNGTMLSGTQVTICEPSNDPNLPDPIPVKKWAIYGTLQPLAALFIPASESSIGGTYQYQIKCGGAIVHQSPIYQWVTVYEGVPVILGDRVPICAIIDCPVDQPIELCGTSVIGGVSAQFALVYEGTALCITN